MTAYGFYSNVLSSPTPENAALNEAAAQAMAAVGATRYHRVMTGGTPAADVEDFLDMLAGYGIKTGLGFTDFITINENNNGATYNEEVLEAYASLDGHPAISDLYGGHEIAEYESHADRVARHELMKSHFPNTPVRAYWGDVTGTARQRIHTTVGRSDGRDWSGIVFGNEPDEVIHLSTGNSISIGDSLAWLSRQVTDIRAYSAFGTVNPPSVYLHYNVDIAKPHAQNARVLAYVMNQCRARGADTVLLRTIDTSGGSEVKLAPWQACYDAIAILTGNV